VSDETHATERRATFREVFASVEYRALYTATVLGWIGNYLAKVAVTALVFQETRSVGWSAATFALSYLPWLAGGPFLAALAERYRYREVMVICDLLQMAFIAMVAVVPMPVEMIMVLLFLSSLAAPPAQAARSAVLPLVLTGDRLVMGLSLNLTTGQAAQVLGYLTGGALSAINPRLALVINAATFATSAVLIRTGLRDRPPAMTAAHRSHLLRETGEGFHMVFSTRVLRAIAILVFTSMLFAIVPEGLAAGWAATLVQDASEQGLTQGMIMAANPIGYILGGLIVARLVRPDVRRAMIRPFAVLAPLSLVPSLFAPGIVGIVVMAAVCGFAVAGMMPAMNAMFVQALPNGYRARAFGVMQAGVQIMQGVAVLGTGLLADRYDLPTVVGLWSLAGVGLVLLAIIGWPTAQQFTDAVAAAEARNAAPATADAAPAPADSDGPGRERTSPADGVGATT